ncbi:MAG: GGDEF domain-containing protein [Chromatiales bacterium]|nr:GGDEF domain-containing protein [Chromatiales bacterium]
MPSSRNARVPAPATVPAPPSFQRLAAVAAIAFAAWVGVGAAAAASGLAPLHPGTGWPLALGTLLTAAVFLALALLPQTRDLSARALATVEGAAGIGWATAYLASADPAAAPAALLATGMLTAALLVALPVASPRGLAALGAYSVLGPAFVAAWLVATGEAAGWTFALPLAAQALVAGGLWAAGWLLADERQRREQHREQLAGSLRRATHQAERDQLTNSYNRRHIIELLAREMARSDRAGTPFCVCLLDLDHFKSLNDQHGHLAGDRTLASFARRVRGELRTMDSVNQAGVPSALGRVGGEEFLVLLPDTTLRGALRVAERIREAVGQRPLDGKHEVTVSVGIAEYRGSETVGSLLGRADKALYGAKRGGRNRVHCASREGSTSAVVMPKIPRAS